MKQKLLRNFRWRRDADKHGPREMAVVELLPRGCRVLSFSRHNKGFLCEVEPFVENEDKDKANSELLRQALSETSLDCQYISVILNRGHSVVQLVNLKDDTEDGEAEQDIAEQIRASIGIEEEWRLAYDFISPTTENTAEADVGQAVVTALPEDEANSLAEAVEDEGFSPVSLTLSAAAVINLAESSKSLLKNDNAVGFLEISDNSSILILYVNKKLALVRQFRTGTQDFLKTIMDTYGLDSETAEKQLASGSFDFSAHLGNDFSYWIRQLGISLKFIEREERCWVEKLYVLERMVDVQTLQHVLANQLNTEILSWEIEANFLTQNHQGLEERKLQAAFSLLYAEGQKIMEQSTKSNNDTST